MKWYVYKQVQSGEWVDSDSIQGVGGEEDNEGSRGAVEGK